MRSSAADRQGSAMAAAGSVRDEGEGAPSGLPRSCVLESTTRRINFIPPSSHLPGAGQSSGCPGAPRGLF